MNGRGRDVTRQLRSCPLRRREAQTWCPSGAIVCVSLQDVREGRVFLIEKGIETQACRAEMTGWGRGLESLWRNYLSSRHRKRLCPPNAGFVLVSYQAVRETLCSINDSVCSVEKDSTTHACSRDRKRCALDGRRLSSVVRSVTWERTRGMGVKRCFGLSPGTAWCFVQQ